MPPTGKEIPFAGKIKIVFKLEKVSKEKRVKEVAKIEEIKSPVVEEEDQFLDLGDDDDDEDLLESEVEDEDEDEGAEDGEEDEEARMKAQEEHSSGTVSFMPRRHQLNTVGASLARDRSQGKTGGSLMESSAITLDPLLQSVAEAAEEDEHDQ